MPRLFYGNFDFEESLARQDGRARTAAMQRLLTELTPIWIAVAQPGDLIWCPQPVDSAYYQYLESNGIQDVRGVSTPADVPSGYEFVPWGWTAEAVRFAKQVEANCAAPPPEAARAVNSREFSNALEQRAGSLGIASCEVANKEQLCAAIQSLGNESSRWVVKAEFSNSSRERFLHVGTSVDLERVCKWAARRFQWGQRLYVEPWLNRINEVGLQWDVPSDGDPMLVGVTGIVADETGQFRGCDFTPGREDDPLWRPVIEATRAAAREAQAVGYFGPLGVDAMCYRDASGRLRYRAFQDVNARWTMGRLSLAFRTLLKPDEQGCWVQQDAGLTGDLDTESRTVLSSPELIDGRAVQLRYAVVCRRPRSC